MIKVRDVINIELNGKVIYELFADTKAEVTSTITVVGAMGDPAAGTKVITAAGEEGYLKSDGTWGWVS